MSNFTKERFNYEVQTSPVYFECGGEFCEVPNKQIIKTSDNKVLSIMSKSYNLFTNEQFCDLAEQISDTLSLKLQWYADYKGGRQVLASFKNESELSILGHTFNSNIVLFDSRDGTTCLGLAGVGMLHRCKNMFTSVKNSKTQYKIRHNNKLEEMVAEFQLNLEMYHIAAQQRIKRLEALEGVKITDKNAMEWIAKWQETQADKVAGVLKGKEDVLAEVSTRKQGIITDAWESWKTESNDLGKNGFALWNATTHYYTHARDKKPTDFLFADAGYQEERSIKFAEAL